MANTRGSPFPSQNQELLLKAALLGGEEMLTAFREWKKQVDFEKDIRYDTFRMLPLLYYNLHKHLFQDELMPRLKGIYRQSWSKNHLLFYKTGQVLRLLHHAGIKTIVMKGIPLSILVYKNFAIRPMADMDVLVPTARAAYTIDLLKKNGWQLYNPHYLAFNLKYGRSATLADSEKTEFDLHWHPVFECHDAIAENEFWDQAVPLTVSGEKTLSFCTTDLFFHTIVHGLRYNPEPPVRWIADAMAILNSTENTVNWDILLDRTRKFRVTLYMKDALNYLAEKFHAPVPDEIIEKINNIRISRTEKFVFRHALKYGDKPPESFFEKFYSVYAAYMRQTAKRNVIGQHTGFLKYMWFRTKGKPRFRLMVYQISQLMKSKKKKRLAIK